MPKSGSKTSKYQRRIASGLARGLSRAQARGHAPHPKGKGKQDLPDIDSPLWRAYLDFQASKNISAVARTNRVAPERLRRLIKSHGLAERVRGKWRSTDSLTRRVLIYTKGKEKSLLVRGYEDASVAGSYWHAAHSFVQTNDIDLLAPFVGRSVKDSKGRHHPLETDPNVIHRLAAAGGPAFHEIYRVTI